MTFPISASSPMSDIEELQQALADAAFDIAIDGIFGPQTLAAVKLFQSRNLDRSGHPLVVDGIVGPATWASLTVRAITPVPSDGPFAGFDALAYPGDAA